MKNVEQALGLFDRLQPPLDSSLDILIFDPAQIPGELSRKRTFTRRARAA